MGTRQQTSTREAAGRTQAHARPSEGAGRAAGLPEAVRIAHVARARQGDSLTHAERSRAAPRPSTQAKAAAKRLQAKSRSAILRRCDQFHGNIGAVLRCLKRGPLLPNTRADRALGGGCQEALRLLLNACLRHEDIPTPWKQSVIVPIPKAAELAGNLDQLRPIVLETSRKTLSAILARRLQQAIEQLSYSLATQHDYLLYHKKLDHRQPVRPRCLPSALALPSACLPPFCHFPFCIFITLAVCTAYRCTLSHIVRSPRS